MHDKVSASTLLPEKVDQPVYGMGAHQARPPRKGLRPRRADVARAPQAVLAPQRRSWLNVVGATRDWLVDRHPLCSGRNLLRTW